jgi:hypothetical protein
VQWDYALESFEVMAALAEATDRIRATTGADPKAITFLILQ